VRATVLNVLVVLTACGHGASHPPPRTLSNVAGPERDPGDTPVRCPDPIAGKWRARVYRAEVGKIDDVVLTLTRAGDELRGAIIVTSWDVDESDDEPPTCPDGSAAIGRVTQSANGWIHGSDVDIAGSDPDRSAAPCGVAPNGTYTPDHFTGELDDGMLVTTNDDGGTDQGRPHVFERVGCSP
jgi:hypothetical protein